MTKSAYSPMKPPAREVSQERMQEILRKHSATPSAAGRATAEPSPTLSSEGSEPAAVGAAVPIQLEWLEPDRPGARGYYDTGRRYSVYSITIAGKVFWECWKLMPKASWFTVLGCMLPTEAAARELAQKDSEK